MPENAGVDPQGSRTARAPRSLVLVAVLALAVGLAVAGNTLSERSTQPPFRTPSADVTTLSGPTPTDSTTTYIYLVETALPDIGGLALGGQPITNSLTRRDPTAVNGAWTVVVRRADGSLGRYGAVVTYPAPTNDAANTGATIRVGSASGISGPGFILWPLGNGQARIRGDLPQADLVHIAELTTVVAGRPRVRPPAGFRVIARAPSRLPLVHEIRYASSGLGVGPALGDGLTYTGLTSGGGVRGRALRRGRDTSRNGTRRCGGPVIGTGGQRHPRVGAVTWRGRVRRLERRPSERRDSHRPAHPGRGHIHSDP